MRYLDTSLVVAAITNERDTEIAQRALSSGPDGEALAVSDWVVTELSAALSMKVRLGLLTESERRRAERAFALMRIDSFGALPVTSADFAAAAVLAGRHRSGLRAGDSLHLAVAAAAGATIHTLDRGLVRAARLLKLPAVLVA